VAMLQNLDIDIWLNIMNYLDFGSIITTRYYLKDKKLDEIVYWKSLERNVKLISCKYLIADQYKFNIEDELQAIYNYVKDNENIFIAGGYCSIQYFERNLKDFDLSDIDIYIMNVTKDPVTTFKDFVTFLLPFGLKIYTIGHSIYNLKIDSSRRIIQVIVTAATSPTKILMDFDSSHARCGVYMGLTYVTYDAIHTKKKQSVYVISSRNHEKRLEKIKKLSLNIFSVDHEFNGDIIPNNYKKMHWDTVHHTTDIDHDIRINDIQPISHWTSQYHENTFALTSELQTGAHISRDINILDCTITAETLANFNVIYLNSRNNQYYKCIQESHATLWCKHNNYNYYLNEALIGIFKISVSADILHKTNTTLSIKLVDNIETVVASIDKLNMCGRYMSNLIHIPYQDVIYCYTNDNVFTLNNISDSDWSWKNNGTFSLLFQFRVRRNILRVHVF
jgi:hypothetical protein